MRRQPRDAPSGRTEPALSGAPSPVAENWVTSEDASGHLVDGHVAIAGVSTDRQEGRLWCHAEPGGQEPLRLLDRDPRTERCLQLLMSAANSRSWRLHSVMSWP